MTTHAALVENALDDHVTPALLAMGFVRARRRSAWTEGRLQIRSVLDSKATDPYGGGAFTLEFEVSEDGRFEEKLAGRVRLDQLLDEPQRTRFLRVRNTIARRVGPPPEDHLALIDPAVRAEYLKPFEEAAELESGHRFWMRFRTPDHLNDWCRLVVAELPGLVERAREIPAHGLILGKPLKWS